MNHTTSNVKATDQNDLLVHEQRHRVSFATGHCSINWIKVQGVARPHVRSTEIRMFKTKQLYSLTCTISRCTVTMKDVTFISDASDGWQFVLIVGKMQLPEDFRTFNFELNNSHLFRQKLMPTLHDNDVIVA